METNIKKEVQVVHKRKTTDVLRKNWDMTTGLLRKNWDMTLDVLMGFDNRCSKNMDILRKNWDMTTDVLGTGT